MWPTTTNLSQGNYWYISYVSFAATPELQQPIQLSVIDSGDVVGSLTLLNFYPQDIMVDWTCNPDQYKQSLPKKKVIGDQNGTFRLDSQYTIPGKLLENPQFIMKVTWKHESMERPEYREISIQDPGEIKHKITRHTIGQSRQGERSSCCSTIHQWNGALFLRLSCPRYPMLLGMGRHKTFTLSFIWWGRE